ncbi:uncharacterized protein NPIL_600881 [Nephila pilipes]|uniref:DUF7041 domain-containing protein n=1 Tax=Nephila pilipes TaxID=299642 RepID=A0A8X6IZK2_NEPPI|nr:uncharacterized protein NPIL_600881 [Nephila pilipes]
MTEDSIAQQQVSRVAAKLPPLWKHNIKLWLLQAEANFELFVITNDVTKHNNVLPAIDSKILSVVSDFLFDPPHADRYATLKNRLIQKFSDSENLQIRKLLSELQLGDDKPSPLLRKMKELAGTALNDDFLRNLWLQRLSADIQTILSVSSEKLENLAKLADKIAEVHASPFTLNVYAVAGRSEQSSEFPNSPLNEMIALRGEIAALSKQVERLPRDRSRNRSRRRYGRSPYKSKTPSRMDDYHFNDDFSYYHNQFGSKAKKCREPCTFDQASEN